MNYFKQKFQKGFTLLELLIAVLILSIALTAIFTLINSTVFATRMAKNEITANFLLQDALENIRNNRDSTLNAGFLWSDWTMSSSGACPLTVPGSSVIPSLCNCMAFPSGAPVGTRTCNLDTINNVAVDCPGGNCTPLLEISAPPTDRKFYCPQSVSCPMPGTLVEFSPFTRRVSMAVNPSNLDEVFVEITIDWFEGGKAMQKTIRQSFLNW